MYDNVNPLDDERKSGTLKVESCRALLSKTLLPQQMIGQEPGEYLYRLMAIGSRRRWLNNVVMVVFIE